MNNEKELEIIEKAYGPKYWEKVKDKIDDQGYIDKKTMAELIGKNPENKNDSWIMHLEGWHYEVHFGVEKFRPIKYLKLRQKL